LLTCCVLSSNVLSNTEPGDRAILLESRTQPTSTSVPEQNSSDSKFVRHKQPKFVSSYVRTFVYRPKFRGSIEKPSTRVSDEDAELSFLVSSSSG
jgi:hypothetical protein